MIAPGTTGHWSGLGHWNLYFLAKLLLAWQGSLSLQVLPNLLLAAVLLLPLGLWLARLRLLLAVPAALALLYQESPLPPVERLTALSGLLDFSPEYLLELAGRFFSVREAGAVALCLLAYYLLSPWLRLSSLSLGGLLWLALLQVPLPAFWPLLQSETVQAASTPAAGSTAAPAEADLDQWLVEFHAREAQRRVSFPAASGTPPFDLLVLNICSLAWSDLRQVGLVQHPLLQDMDILFEQFNSATSYSGPAAIRLLRASCGQPAHSQLYQAADAQCQLFDNLAQLGFSKHLALNHNGRFEGFGDMLRAHGNLPAAQSSEGLRRAWVAFDGTPIWSDGEVLERWWQQRSAQDPAPAALFYNTITLHDGNRVIEVDGGTRSATYAERATRLMDDLQAFLTALERSGRPVVVVLVPEHGAALRGDALQIAGLREYPSRSITHVPVGLRLINLPLDETAPQRVSTPSSYLAVAEIIARLLAGIPAGQSAFSPAALVRDLPVSEWVAESEGGVVVAPAGIDYLRVREGGAWRRYPVPLDAGGQDGR